MIDMTVVDNADRDAQPTFEQLMDTAPLMIWASSPDKLRTWFNRRWLEFTGRAMSQERGNGWAEGIHPDDRQRRFEIDTAHFDQRLAFRMEYRLRRSDGEYRWILDTGVPRFDSRGVFLGYIGTCIDINAIRKIELDIGDGAASRDIGLDALDRVAGGVAHEFSNLVGAFLGDLWVIRKNAHDADTVRRRAEQAEDALIEGQRIIEQLLANLRELPRPSHGAGSA
jgi:PAS domain S-box-containing protein